MVYNRPQPFIFHKVDLEDMHLDIIPAYHYIIKDLIFTGTGLVCFEYVDHPHGKVADKEKGDDLSAWLVTNVGLC